MTWEWKGDDGLEYTEISENADGVCSVLQLEKGLTSNCKKIKIENSFSDTNENKLVESQLTIEDIELGDSGKYRCVAGNQSQYTSGIQLPHCFSSRIYLKTDTRNDMIT